MWWPVTGNFDDAQSGVKSSVRGQGPGERRWRPQGCQFSSANSINIGRLVPQIVYYVYAYAQASGERGDPGRASKINVTVPTGNFGNILAAYLCEADGTAH